MRPAPTLVCALALACTHGRAPVTHAVTVPSLDAAPAPPPTIAHSNRDAPASFVWRVLDHVFVTNDAGVALVTSITLELEVGGQIVGPFTLSEPGCTLGSLGGDSNNADTDAGGDRVVSGLTCYYAGGGDYVEVRRRKPNEYVVVTYAQSESYPDEPLPPKTGMRVLGAVHTTSEPSDEALVAADGGRYVPYD